MNSVGENFAEIKKQSQIKRLKNRIQTQKLLKNTGVKFTEHNNGAHLVITADEIVFDLWPGTGKYLNRNTKEYGRGVFNLLGEIDE